MDASIPICTVAQHRITTSLEFSIDTESLCMNMNKGIVNNHKGTMASKSRLLSTICPESSRREPLIWVHIPHFLGFLLAGGGQIKLKQHGTDGAGRGSQPSC